MLFRKAVPKFVGAVFYFYDHENCFYGYAGFRGAFFGSFE